MPRQFGPIVETLMRRVRQEGGLAVEPNFALKMYSYCEQIINTHTQRVTTSGTLTVPIQRLLFNYRDATEAFPDAIDIISIRQNSRRIEKCDNLSQFAAYDIDWFRKIDGTRIEAWHQIGRDILILYPGLVTASSVVVEYVKLLTLRTNFTLEYNIDSDLPSEDIELALKLAEIVLLARFRQIQSAANSIKTFLEILKQRKVEK